MIEKYKKYEAVGDCLEAIESLSFEDRTAIWSKAKELTERYVSFRQFSPKETINHFKQIKEEYAAQLFREHHQNIVKEFLKEV